MKKSDIKKELVIVGLGASAGGLEALTLFLSNLPSKLDNIAYVVVQHLSPTHNSMMRELLARETSFDVLDIQTGLLPKANTVYITPPDRDVTLRNGLFFLEKPLDRWIGPKPSIDKFFISLAQEKQEKAVGVILSGTGTDGAQGVRAIRAEGGIAIAQDPKQAKYDGMPASAIQTKSVDYILKAEEIAQEIIHLIRYPNSLRVEKAKEDELMSIFELLRQHFHIDFSQYKTSTITRRIERRMAAIKATSLSDYTSYLTSNKEEVELLYQDMLIGVTSFFRDTDAFEELKEQLTRYVQVYAGSEQIRVWIPACSTGEEAYSVAIILDEILGGNAQQHIKIFATDIDEEAIQKARAGVYPELIISNISPERLSRYFIQRGNEFEVKAKLKERVIFSRHDITMDPPFVNLDLITCRNLLIYFETELQKKIFTTFAYSLKQHGLLFLGKSESVGVHTDLFSTVDSKVKIFQARTTIESKKLLYPQMLNAGKYIKPSSTTKHKKSDSIEENIKNTLFEYYENRCVVIDNDFNIHYIKGNMNDMLKFPHGEMNNNILKMLPEKVSLEVRSLVYKANKNESNITFPAEAECVLEDEIATIKLSPIEGYAGNYLYFLVCFESTAIQHTEEKRKPSDSDGAYIKQLEQELQATREHLQTVVEELETSNEELQSSNEELQASNEELQASNEELETTNEELQSTNEELQTAYSEIRALYEKQNLQKNYLQDKARELSMVKEQLDLQYKFAKDILDSEKNIVVVTDGSKIISVNDQFFQFFPQYTSLNEFQQEHQCIHEMFEDVNQDGYVFNKKDGNKWLEVLKLSPRNDLKVAIKKDRVIHTFHVMLNTLKEEKETYVITFTDISEFMVSRQKIEDALQDEIINSISSSKMVHQFNSIFGNDLFIKFTTEELRKPLNSIYLNYLHILEIAGFTDDIKDTYINRFLSFKEEVLDNLEALKHHFVVNDTKNVSIYKLFQKTAQILSRANNHFVMEIYGSENTIFHDKIGQMPQLITLFCTSLLKIMESAGITDVLLKIIIEENNGIINIRMHNAIEYNPIFTELLKLDGNNDVLTQDVQVIREGLLIFNILSKDVYHMNSTFNAEYCTFDISKRC